MTLTSLLAVSSVSGSFSVTVWVATRSAARENVSPNVTLATASYNAGPSKAAAWRSTLTKEVEGALFAETIPYSETRDYVMRVTANTVQYSRYTNDPIHLTDLLGRIEPVPLSGNIIP